MPETIAIVKKEPEGTDVPPTVGWAEFLAGHPPLKPRSVLGAARHMTPPGPNFVLNTPDLHLYCHSEKCSGDREFRCDSCTPMQPSLNYWNRIFLTYRCRNCETTTKEYALRILWNFTHKLDPNGQSGPQRYVANAKLEGFAKEANEKTPAEVVKIGEWPPLGPSVPKNLRKLLGKPEYKLFLTGRRAEGQGMGIAAFAYYRRVVENQRTLLFDKIIAAAERLKVEPQTIRDLKEDRDKWQFTQSVKELKAILPDSLRVCGHSPLALLHHALSHNLHNESDEICLEAASDIRMVLTKFAEQLDFVLKEQTALEKAVERLSNPLKTHI